MADDQSSFHESAFQELRQLQTGVTECKLTFRAPQILGRQPDYSQTALIEGVRTHSAEYCATYA